jgi:hypothetical protein
MQGLERIQILAMFFASLGFACNHTPNEKFLSAEYLAERYDPVVIQ